MNGRMANGALLVLDPSLIMERWDGGVFRKLLGDARVALDAKLTDRCSLKHFRICRAVRYVAHGAAFEFERCMFVNKRPLLIHATSAPTASLVCLFSKPPCGLWQSLHFIVPSSTL